MVPDRQQTWAPIDVVQDVNRHTQLRDGAVDEQEHLKQGGALDHRGPSSTERRASSKKSDPTALGVAPGLQ